MQSQFDIRQILVFFVLPVIFVAVCAILALLLWLLAPKRFGAARTLLFLPGIGMLVGVPVAIIAQMRPDLVVWMGTSCMSVIMAIGFLILGVATFIRAAAGWPEPVKRRRRRRDDDDLD